MEANRITTLRSKWTTGMAAMLLGATLVLSACAPTGTGTVDTTATTTPEIDDAAADDAVTPEATIMAGEEMTGTEGMDDSDMMTDTEGMDDSDMMTGTEGMDDSDMMTDTEGMDDSDMMTDTEGMDDSEGITDTDTITN